MFFLHLNDQEGRTFPNVPQYARGNLLLQYESEKLAEIIEVASEMLYYNLCSSYAINLIISLIINTSLYRIWGAINST